MSEFPLVYAHGHLLRGPRGEWAALYRVRTTSYPYLDVRSKLDLLGRLARFARSTEADFSLWRVCRTYPVERYAERAGGMLDERYQTREAWDGYLLGHRDHIERSAPFVPEVYVAVALPLQSSRAPGSAIVRMADAARSWFKRGPVRVAASELARATEAEQLARQRADAALSVQPATTRELQWLLRRAAARGVAEPLIDLQWAPAALEVDGVLEPLATDVWRCANAPLYEEERALVCDAEEGRSFQAMLALGHGPERAVFPGATELLFTPLEASPFPVDVAMHVGWVRNRDALKKVKQRVIDADQAYTDQLDQRHGPLSYVAEENRVMARELDALLSGPSHPPLLMTATSLAVGAPDRETLERRVEALRHRYGAVALHRPLGLQAAMFLDHLPRADAGRVRDYRDVMTVEQFGSLMPTGTHETGSEFGAYLGRVAGGGRRPVLFDVTAASRAGRPPSILLCGALGSGKTMAAQLLAYQAERRGSVVVDVDPKPDHNLEGLSELEGRVHVIELSGDERYRGLLDPLTVAPRSLREDLTHSYLMDLLPRARPEWETEVRRAIKRAMLDSHPCCVSVLEALRSSDSEHARAAGEALAVWSDSGIARLGFGDGYTRLRESERAVTTIKAGGLALPGPDVPRSEYDPAERVAVATLKLVAAYAMRLVQGDRSVHKLVLFDEAWFLLATADGRRLLDRLNRMGRSENATLVLATQQLGDVGEIENLIGTRMVFGQETHSEARRALALLGLDPEDRSLVDRVRGFRKGRCLMRDVDDRVAEVQVELVYEHLLRTWDTTPGARVTA